MISVVCSAVISKQDQSEIPAEGLPMNRYDVQNFDRADPAGLAAKPAAMSEKFG